MGGSEGGRGGGGDDGGDRFPRREPAKPRAPPAPARGGGRRERPASATLPLAARGAEPPGDWPGRPALPWRLSGLNSNRHRERPRGAAGRRHRAGTGSAPAPLRAAPTRRAAGGRPSRSGGDGSRGAAVAPTVGTGSRKGPARRRRRAGGRGAGPGRWAAGAGRAQRREATRRPRRRPGRREGAEGVAAAACPPGWPVTGVPAGFPANASLLPPRRSGGTCDAERRGGCRLLRLRGGGRMQQAGGEMGTDGKVSAPVRLAPLRWETRPAATPRRGLRWARAGGARRADSPGLPLRGRSLHLGRGIASVPTNACGKRWVAAAERAVPSLSSVCLTKVPAAAPGPPAAARLPAAPGEGAPRSLSVAFCRGLTRARMVFSAEGKKRKISSRKPRARVLS